jgi:hypothetical protein
VLIWNAHAKRRDLLRGKAFRVLVALAMLLATTAVIDSNLATTHRQVGLGVGDTAEYTMTGEGAWYADRFTLHVTYVEGSHINFSGTYYHNGTVRHTYEFSGDVGDLGNNEMLQFLVAANLKAGDLILTYVNWTGSNVTISIKETVSKEVAGYQRSVNYAEDIPLGLFYATDQPYGVAMYWDQATGILVEAYVITMTGDEDWALVSTSAFNPPDYAAGSLLIVGGLAAVASVVTVAIIVNRRKPE